MTVSSTARKAGPFSGNGSTTSFPFSFKIFTKNDVQVVRADASGIETTLTLDSDYSVAVNADQTASPGGTITYPISGSPLASGLTLAVIGALAYNQGTSLPTGGAFNAANVEAALDRLTILNQQLLEKVSRAALVPVTNSADAAVLVADILLLANNITALNAIVANISNINAVNANATNINAVASNNTNVTAVGGSITNVNAVAGNSSNINTVAGNNANINTAATNISAIVAAPTQASNAAASAVAAAASAAAASSAIASALWRDVVFVTAANSPIAVSQSDNGKLYCVDTSGGNVTVNLPSVASTTMPFNVSFKKESSDANVITINRSATDTIDGATSKAISTAASGTTLVADADPAPDMWTAADFGAVAGNMVPNVFSGNASTTGFTLSASPGSPNNVHVFIGGIRQVPTTDYTVSGTTLNFTSAPPSGTNNIFALSGTTLSIGTPADATVSTAKVQDGAITAVKLGSGAAAANLGLSAWSVVETAGVLYFKYSGTNKFKIDGSGNLTVAGNVTAFGTV